MVGLSIRFWLIYAYPIVFGGDTIVRLANRDHILLSYQLPLLQLLIYGVSRISHELAPVRGLMAVIGAAAGVAFYWLMRLFVSERSALLAALLFAAHPFLVQLSIVPYQEVLMLAALLLALGFFFRQRWTATSGSLGLACLTRYEAWIACPLLALARRQSGVRLASACLLFGWAPLAWVMFHHGVSSAGTYVIEWPRSAWRLMRWVYLGWITLKNTPPPVLALAIMGLWRMWRNRLLSDPRARLLVIFLGLFLLATLFSAHGVTPDPERFITSREATIPIAAVMALAALGLEESRGWFASALVTLGLGWCLVDVNRFLRRDTSEAHLQLSYQLAQYLDRSVGEHETVLIVARPAPEEMIQDYLSRVRRRGGEAEVSRAKKLLASMDISPPDCQRVIVHSRIGKPRLACAGDPATSQWIAVWSDSGAAVTAAGRILRTRLQSGGVSVRVYRQLTHGESRPASADSVLTLH